MDNCDDIDLINNLFKGAICTYGHKTTNRKSKHQRFNLGPHNGFISIWDAIKLHNNNDNSFKIISIDLTGSKLGEMLKDAPK
jgi:hypothetical protein